MIQPRDLVYDRIRPHDLIDDRKEIKWQLKFFLALGFGILVLISVIVFLILKFVR